MKRTLIFIVWLIAIHSHTQAQEDEKNENPYSRMLRQILFLTWKN